MTGFMIDYYVEAVPLQIGPRIGRGVDSWIGDDVTAQFVVAAWRSNQGTQVPTNLFACVTHLGQNHVTYLSSAAAHPSTPR